MSPSHDKQHFMNIYSLIQFQKCAGFFVVLFFFFPSGVIIKLLHSPSPEEASGNLRFSNFFPVLKWFVHEC